MTIAVKEPIDAICAVALHQPNAQIGEHFFYNAKCKRRARKGGDGSIHRMDVWNHRPGSTLHEFIFNSMFQSSTFTPILPGTCML